MLRDTNKILYGISLFLFVTLGQSCTKDGNPHNLPEVHPSDYEGTIDGFRSTDEVYPDNLVAYFSFDDHADEQLTGISPTSSQGIAFVEGWKNKALQLTEGYVYYAHAFEAFHEDHFRSFSISQWIQIANNGSTRTQLFQLARPGLPTGNIDIVLQTQNRPPSNIDFITIQPSFASVSGGRQDNVNNRLSPMVGPENWVHLVISYSGLTGTFHIIANGESIGGYNNRGIGNALFKSYSPHELIIGGNYNVIPQLRVSQDRSFAAMTGKIDELRIYNTYLSPAIANALYRLGLANQ